jgi:hypothetical protein
MAPVVSVVMVALVMVAISFDAPSTTALLAVAVPAVTPSKAPSSETLIVDSAPEESVVTISAFLPMTSLRVTRTKEKIRSNMIYSHNNT